MSADAIWQAFAETGDPLYYLLYKTTREAAENGQEKKDERRGDKYPSAQV